MASVYFFQPPGYHLCSIRPGSAGAGLRVRPQSKIRAEEADSRLFQEAMQRHGAEDERRNRRKAVSIFGALPPNRLDCLPQTR
jgi:hypothetical protein